MNKGVRVALWSLGGIAGLIVIAAIIVAPFIMDYIDRSVVEAYTRVEVGSTELHVQVLDAAVRAFGKDMGRYPTAEEGLQALVRRPAGSEDWAGSYLTTSVLPVDGWNRSFIYSPTSTRGVEYEIRSMGPDGIDGTADDIGNWQLGK